MKIRLLAEARGAYRTEFLTELIKCGQEIEVTLHFGDKNSDFDAPSLMRQERKRGQRGYLFDKIINDRKIIELIQNTDFEKSLARFIDHLNRASERYVGRSHSMYQLHEYVDYYNILVSSIADKIIAEKITHVLFFDIPHLAVDTAIYDVAKSLKLDVLILCQLYPSRVFSCSRIEDFVFKDIIGHRKTQKFGSMDTFFHELWNNAIEDELLNLSKFKNTLNQYQLFYVLY